MDIKNSKNGRKESVKAHIYKRHIGTGTNTNNQTRIYAREMGTENDDAGHIVARQLGGTGTESYNIFPQNKDINRGNNGEFDNWRRFEQELVETAETLDSTSYIEIEYNLYYENENATRPTTMHISTFIVRGQTREALYNFVWELPNYL